MGAYAHEVALARQDGVDFVYWAQPVALIGEHGRVCGLRCKRTQLVDGKLEEIEGSEFDLPVDLVLRATGQRKLTEFWKAVASVELNRNGCVAVDDQGPDGPF